MDGNSILNLGLTPRHHDEGMGRYVSKYLCDSVPFGTDPYEVGYQTVIYWRESGLFAPYSEVHLYYSGYVPLLVGVMDAFDELRIPYVLMRYDNVKRIYKPINRKVARQK